MQKINFAHRKALVLCGFYSEQGTSSGYMIVINDSLKGKHSLEKRVEVTTIFLRKRWREIVTYCL
jgi:hypothetical protein